jgi:hypothetical protein
MDKMRRTRTMDGLWEAKEILILCHVTIPRKTFLIIVWWPQRDCCVVLFELFNLLIFFRFKWTM